MLIGTSIVELLLSLIETFSFLNNPPASSLPSLASKLKNVLELLKSNWFNTNGLSKDYAVRLLNTFLALLVNAPLPDTVLVLSILIAVSVETPDTLVNISKACR